MNRFDSHRGLARRNGGGARNWKVHRRSKGTANGVRRESP